MPYWKTNKPNVKIFSRFLLCKKNCYKPFGDRLYVHFDVQVLKYMRMADSESIQSNVYEFECTDPKFAIKKCYKNMEDKWYISGILRVKDPIKKT